jgi:predicted ATP-dependent protease
MRELKPTQLRKECPPERFKFTTTAELKGLSQVMGQQRAMDALEFAADINSQGYNVYVMGQIGTGRSASSRGFLEKWAAKQPVPDEWCYVYNFADPRVPKSVNVPAGKGIEWQADMDQVIGELADQVTLAFESEDYIEKRDDILRGFREERNRELQEFEKGVESAGFTLGRSPAGLIVAPAHEGEVMDPQQYRELPEEERDRLEETRQELQATLAEIMRRGQREERHTRRSVADLDRDVAREVIEPLLEEIREKHSGHRPVIEHLNAVRDDLLENISAIRQAAEDGDEQMRFAAAMQGHTGTGAMPIMERYRVNLLVNNGELNGAPVIHEPNPTIEALTGEVEHQTQMGALVTDFTMIKAGALHRANGGYLLLSVHQLLQRPYAWDALKRALSNQQIRIESLRDQLRFISTVSLEPQAIDLQVKVILVGSPLLYYLLYEYDEDFRKLFKVKSDFDSTMDRVAASERQYAGMICEICNKEELPHFTPEAVAKVVEHGSRLVSDQKKLSTNFSLLSAVVREAGYWAGRNGHPAVGTDDVEAALAQQVYRSSRIEERIREMISDGTIMVDVEGEVVGQINGTAVIGLGDYMMGKPSRITCRTYLGRAGIVNIDREAKLTGRIHDKGILTLTGFLGDRYGQSMPISLSASIAFEQLYEEVEGDSAASTELYALLSSLARVPIKQGIAVTGSVNQLGQVQAIGGVNAKIEGFFKTCKEIGLNGEQGMLIPDANRQHLMLDAEVVEAVEAGDFHIWAVKTIDEGIEVLTGKKAGTRRKNGKYPDDSINGLVEARLAEMAQQMKDFMRPAPENNKPGNSDKE